MKLTGKIIQGSHRGTEVTHLPTINLDQTPEDLDHGVYAVWVRFNGESYKGGMNWGARPTFDDLKPVMEVHLLNYEGDLYDKMVEVEVIKRLRDIQKFNSPELLVAQIQKDIDAIETLLV